VTNFGFTNRVLVVTGDVVLPVVCWGACVDCAAAPVFYDVTFQVDMNEQTGFTTPELNGSFNGWCGSCTAMSDANGDGIWSVTVTLQEGTYEYKFSHDNWTGQEALAPGSSCTVTTDIYTNRVLNVSQDEVLPAVCYGSCAVCGVNTGPFDVTFSVDMNEVAFPFTTPEINGTFNGWCGNCAAMSDADGDNVWSITIPLDAGNYEYKFSYDTWSGEEALTVGSSCTVTNPEGFTNRTIAVTGATDAGVVCWESCVACNVVVLNQMSLPLTFDDAGVEYGLIGFDGSEVSSIVVDPTNASNMVAQVIKSASAGGSSGVTITAPAELGFSSAIPFTADATTMSVRVWSPDAGIQVRLKVEDHTNPTQSVETNVITTVANDWETLTFDFSNESAGTAPLNLGYSYDKATIFFNFGVDGATAGEKTYYFDDVVFGGEVVVVNEYSVTFQVDMNGVVGFTTPEVNGTFNNWCGSCFPMSDTNGDGIWEATTTLQEGIHEFKFSHDNWTGSEQLTSSDPCTVTNGNFVNRALNIASDTILAPVCWGLCGPCTMPEPVSITLNLDLGDAVATSAEVTGSFNNYCVGCQPMTSLGNNQYSLTFEEMPGVHYYQFTINGGTQIENLAEGTCTVSFESLIARELVASEDVNVGMVCWESCAPCLVNVDEVNPTEFVVSPNPANNQCMIQFSQGSMASYQLMDAVGRVVLDGSTNGAKQMVLSTEQLPAGLYQLVVSNASRQFTQKIIVQH
jgi:hypothetical protein